MVGKDAHEIGDRLAEYEFVVRNIRQGIWRLDADGTILFVNPFLAGWLESTPERMVGRNVREFLPGGELGHEREADADRFECEFVTETGLLRRSIVVSSPLTGADGSVGRVEVVTDITAEHAVQSRLVQEVQRMAHLASRDPLTNVFNRRAFELALADWAEEAVRRPFGLILFDLDGLKAINDRLGHEAGDRAIVQFAERLLASVRESDMVYRIGGDEFAVLVPEVSQQGLAEIEQRLRECLPFDERLNDEPVHVVASMGSAHSSEFGVKIYESADRAMYGDKRRRRVSDR